MDDLLAVYGNNKQLGMDPYLNIEDNALTKIDKKTMIWIGKLA